MNAQKKVVLRKLDGGVAWGYLPQAGFLRDGEVEMMEVDGRLISFAISEIKMLSYVRDFNRDDPNEPERMGRRSFVGRPRGDGLWVRLDFLDGDSLEGLADFGMGMLDSLSGDGGFYVTPPEGRGNSQRVFVPRMALRSVEVLGWVTAPSKRGKVVKKKKEEKQAGLFAE